MPDVFVANKQPVDSKPTTNQPVENAKDHPEALVGLTRGDTKNPLAAFSVHPPAVRFETQASEEVILLLLRQHFIRLVPWIILFIVMLIIPLWFPVVIKLLAIDLTIIPLGFRFIAVLVWYLISFGLAFQSFLYWYFNVYIVTNERAIDIDFLSLMYKRVSDAPIAKIQDVSYSMGGLVRAIFDYGDVTIQTAGELPNFDFEAVPHPDKVAKVIGDLMQKEENEHVLI